MTAASDHYLNNNEAFRRSISVLLSLKQKYCINLILATYFDVGQQVQSQYLQIKMWLQSTRFPNIKQKGQLVVNR